MYSSTKIRYADISFDSLLANVDESLAAQGKCRAKDNYDNPFELFVRENQNQAGLSSKDHSNMTFANIILINVDCRGDQLKILQTESMKDEYNTSWN